MSDEPTGTPVQLGGKAYLVTVTSETPRRSVYYVTCPNDRARSWKPGEVRIGTESRAVCLTCKRHPADPCIHVAIVTRYLAAQPLEAVPGVESTRDVMLRELAGGAP